MKIRPLFRLLITAVALVGAILLLLVQLAAAAWNGMNAVSWLCLLITVVALLAVGASFSNIYGRRKRTAWFSFAGTLALAACAGFLLVHRFLYPEPGDNNPIFIAGIPITIPVLFAVPAVSSGFVALFSFFDARSGLVPQSERRQSE